MLPCRKRKPTTSKHSVESKTHANTANAFSVQPAAKKVTVLPLVADMEMVEQSSSKKSKTDGTDAVVQEDRATTPQQPLVAEESRKTAKLLHGDETKKTPGQVAAAFRWNQKLKELKAYEAEHGDCLVPQNYSANPPLGSWVSKQRKNYKRLKNGRQSSITKGQIEKLETINGWEWVARGRHRKNQSIWNLRLFELQKYKQEHGHLHVPRKYQKSPQLGTWVHNQREQYKLLKNGHHSCMTEDRIKKLEAIGGWVWLSRGNRLVWDVRLPELQTDRNLSQVKQVGSRVYARYTNKQWYWGKIISIAKKNGSARYEVEFDDKDVLADIKDEHLVLEHEYCSKEESASPSSWRKLVETEPLDEKLDEWGWKRISSGRKKDTGKNDGYWYLSPKTQKQFRSKKKAKMFGLIVEYFDGSEDDGYEYVKKNKKLFDNFLWGNPLKKNCEVKKEKCKVKNPRKANFDEQVAEACMDSINENEVNDEPKIGNPSEGYLMSLKWTETRRRGDNGLVEKWWNPPESSLKFYCVGHAVKYLDLLRETDGDEEAAFKMTKKEANDKPKIRNQSDE